MEFRIGVAAKNAKKILSIFFVSFLWLLHHETMRSGAALVKRLITALKREASSGLVR